MPAILVLGRLRWEDFGDLGVSLDLRVRKKKKAKASVELGGSLIRGFCGRAAEGEWSLRTNSIVGVRGTAIAEVGARMPMRADGRLST